MLWFSGGTFRDEATASVVRPLLQALLPWAAAGSIDALHWLIRKSAHVTEYAILATLWFLPLRRRVGLTRRAAASRAFVIAIGWAILDELYQAAGTTRTGSAADVGIDATGALVASVFAGCGWRDAIAYLTTALLWLAALGGAAVIGVNLAAGVPSGILWVTVPAAAALLLWRRRRSVAHPPDARGV